MRIARKRTFLALESTVRSKASRVGKKSIPDGESIYEL